MLRRSLLPLGLLTATLAGSGGSGGASSPSAPETSQEVDSVSVRMSGTARTMPPAGSGDLTVIGLSGANVKEARVRYPQLNSLNADQARGLTQLICGYGGHYLLYDLADDA